MKPGVLIKRRRFWAAVAAIAGLPMGMVIDGLCLEPKWIKVRKCIFPTRRSSNLGCRMVFFTDLHHKGDQRYLHKLVRLINSLNPSLVCFGGDLVEDPKPVREALDVLGKINAPIFGIPGNHDYWASLDFDNINKAFSQKNGAWLVNQQSSTFDKKVVVHGWAKRSLAELPPPETDRFNILLVHYPEWALDLGDRKYDLILSGHTHGGQVQIPFWGPLILPFDSGGFDKGLFHTDAGPLYVGRGIGWFFMPVRFNCRPELTVFDF